MLWSIDAVPGLIWHWPDKDVVFCIIHDRQKWQRDVPQLHAVRVDCSAGGADNVAHASASLGSLPSQSGTAGVSITRRSRDAWVRTGRRRARPGAECPARAEVTTWHLRASPARASLKHSRHHEMLVTCLD